MKRFLRGKRGQNTAEYAILIALVIAAAIGMQTYTKRGIQGRSKDEVDKLVTDTSGTDLGDFALPKDGYTQFEPYYLDSSFTVKRTSDVTEKFGTKTSLGTAKSAERKTDYEGIERSGKQTYSLPK